MPATRAALRQRTVEAAYGDYYSLTTTSAGATDGTTVVNTDLRSISTDTDFFENWWCLITSGTASGAYRRVTAYAGATGTLTVAPAYAAQIANSVTFEMMPWRPDIIHQSINSAGRQVYPHIYLPVLSETLVTDLIGSNMDFEDGTGSTFTGWTQDTGPTFAETTTRIFHGARAAQITGGTSADLGLYQDLTVNQGQVVGHQITFGGFGWTATASAARLTINFGSAASPNVRSTYHPGNADWRELSVTTSIPSDASRIRLICGVASSGAPVVTYDSMFCYIRPIERYTVPSAFHDVPTHLELQTNRLYPNTFYAVESNWWTEYDGETAYIRFGYRPRPGYRMRLRGRATVTLPSTDTANMEIADEQIDIIAQYAAAEVLERLAAGAGGQDMDQLLQRAALKRQRAAELIALHTMSVPSGATLRLPSKVN